MEENEGIEIYANGPLPAYFKKRAYFTLNKKEFALRKSDALEYLKCCKAEELHVLGCEIWYATIPGPTVRIGVEEGDADRCYDVISKFDVTAERARMGLNADVVFNISVDTN